MIPGLRPLEAPRRWPRRGDLLALALPFLVALVGVLILAQDELDERLVDPFYDPETGRWPLKGAFWTGTFLHGYGQDLVISLGLGGLAVLVLGRFSERARRERRRALYLVLCIVVPAGVTALLKYTSLIPCPWSAVRYGGDIPHWGVFESVPEGTRPGHCFPGAHATSGFSLMGAYYLLRETSRRAAWFGYVLGALIGTAFSVGQVLRGAHFPSHNLWALGIAWGVVSALYWLAFRGRLSPPPRGGGAP